MGGTEGDAPRAAQPTLVARIEQAAWAFFAAALLLVPCELALVSRRTDADALAWAGYLALTLVTAAWASLLVAATTGSFAMLGAELLERLRVPARLRMWCAAVGSSACVGLLGVLAIRPWNLRSDPLHFSISVPLATVLVTLIATALRERLPRQWLLLLALPLAVGGFFANALLYRGLYVSLHTAASWFLWVALAFVLRPYALSASRRVRAATWLVALVAHAGLSDAAPARELGVLYGSLTPTATRALSALADRDRDGYAPLFGGGDCNDDDASVHPGACENARNRVDDNCNGGEHAPKVPLRASNLTPRTPMPDVYLLVLDTLRADFGGPPGRAGLSPTLERLASQSLDFARAYAPYPATVESLNAMIHSRLPRYYDADSADFVSMLAALGFDAQVWLGNARLVVGAKDAAWPPTPKKRNVLTDDDREGLREWTRRIVDEAIAELPRESAKPRFRWLHVMDVHGPWLHAPSDAALRERYQAEIAHVERHLSRLFRALEQAPRTRDAVIIVLGDHGEQLGEHGARFHNAHVWEESIRVPLIMRLPGVAPRRIDTPSSLVDVAPTLLTYLGVDTPESFLGHDWITAPATREEPPIAEFGNSAAVAGGGPPPKQAVIGERYKLSLHVADDIYELYDLARDPGELHPLPRTDTPSVNALFEALRRFQDAPGCHAL